MRFCKVRIKYELYGVKKTLSICLTKPKPAGIIIVEFLSRYSDAVKIRITILQIPQIRCGFGLVRSCRLRQGFFMAKFQNVGIRERIESLIAEFKSEDFFVPVICDNMVIFPGFCDVHTHLREPGFFYKESVATGTKAAARGGYTALCAMPNLNPVPDSLENLRVQLAIIEKDAAINVYPYGAITVGEKGREIAAPEELAPYVCGFSDDGKGVQREEIMRVAMERIKRLDKVLAAHCEDESLLHGGYIREGRYSAAHGHKGIDPASEYMQVRRDLRLAEETGVKYHVCHVSTKESVEAIREAKRRGADVTCETAPHYLLLTENDLREDGRFKMNPPLGSEEDRAALIEGIKDGTIDMIATDHAPHSAEEKGRGLAKSPFGIVGLETAFPLLYTRFVKTGEITAEKLAMLLSVNPRKRFGIPLTKEDYAVFEIGSEYTIDPKEFLSKGKSTPFVGERVYGKCLLTVCGGKTVWQENLTEN